MKEKYRVIYTPKGAAREYSELALNLEIGCSHGCLYCYGAGCMRMTRENFSKPKKRIDLLKKLELDLKDMNKLGDERRTLLCFVTDPYQPDENGYTRLVIELFKKYNKPFQVLTKGGMKATRDFDLYKKYDAYASTIVFDNEKTRKMIEPHAATIESRIESLKIAKEKGIETWLSLEPVIFPEQALRVVDLTMGFVDKYKIGKINNFKLKKEVDWEKFTNDITEKLYRNNLKFYIKESLRPYFKNKEVIGSENNERTTKEFINC